MTSPSPPRSGDTVLFDIDGTLIDSTYHHAVAWHRAFARSGLQMPMWRIHRTIGMGGDKLVTEIAGAQVEEEHGDALREAWVEEFDRLIDEIQPFEGARDLLVELKDRGFRLVLASSGKTQHVERFLELVGGEEIADAYTTSDDAEHSKPEPDIVQTALQRVQGAEGVMVGDSVYDVIAAGKLEVPTLGVLTGGFSREELTEAGALRVFDSLVDLREHLDDTPLARPTGARAA